ncbi:MAG: hypothetical protein QW429_02205 [Thermoprotei archaeon]
MSTTKSTGSTNKAIFDRAFEDILKILDQRHNQGKGGRGKLTNSNLRKILEIVNSTVDKERALLEIAYLVARNAEEKTRDSELWKLFENLKTIESLEGLREYMKTVVMCFYVYYSVNENLNVLKNLRRAG